MVTPVFSFSVNSIAGMLDPSQGGALSPSFSNPLLSTTLSEDFISNTIIFAQQRRHAGQKARPVLSLNATVMLPTDPDALLRVLRPDFYYVDSSEAVVNYATVGVSLAAMAFDAGVSENWDFSEYGRCIKNYARGNEGLALDRYQWRALIKLRWTVQVALQALKTRLLEVVRSHLPHKFFFLRFARVCCAPVSRSIDVDSVEGRLAAVCNLAAMSAPGFGAAFNCPALPRMNC